MTILLLILITGNPSLGGVDTLAPVMSNTRNAEYDSTLRIFIYESKLDLDGWEYLKNYEPEHIYMKGRAPCYPE